MKCYTSEGRSISEPALFTEINAQGEPPNDSPSAVTAIAHQRSCSHNAERYCHSHEAQQSTLDPNDADHDTESDPDDEDADSWYEEAINGNFPLAVEHVDSNLFPLVLCST